MAEEAKIAEFLKPYLIAWGDDRFGLDWQSGDAELDACYSAEQLASLMAQRLTFALSLGAERGAAADLK